MNPVIRRSIPPSVRSLLTDIAPKEEEWTDPAPETETVARDGILLPSKGAGNEEFLSPAKIQKEKVAGDESNTRMSREVCTLCKCKPSNYTCPRCNLQYCGLSCYQSPDHSACSEEFYKESVLQELKEMGKTEAEGRRKMQEILLGLRQKAVATHGGMENFLKEADMVGEGEDEEEAVEKVQVLDLLSKLAELQQSGEENIPEMEAILGKLEEIGGAKVTPGAAGEDADSTEGDLDLAVRLSGLEIDKLSEEELWELLSKKEQEKFMGLLKGGDLSGVLPVWKPWWEEHEEIGRSLIEVLQEEVNKQENASDNQVKISQEDGQKEGESVSKTNKVIGGKRKEKGKSKGSPSGERVPSISANIPKLSSLCANPSPLVCYSLVNALYGYAFALSLYNGDTDSLMFEFCDMTLVLSAALSSGRVFSSVQEALDCGEALVLRDGCLDRDDPLAPARAVEAVAHIMTGRNRRDASGYCLAALSQLRSVLSKARVKLSKEGEEGIRRQKYFQASKKCEFFQAWVKDSVQQIHRLAVELWSEHSKRESVRDSMEKAKTVVQENLKKRKRKRHDKLIEELS
ncbi:zinc finger HIT domain-containing protein 2 [Girardinichthys multiradiatus]|uniref:zinc finger HIT domain-containing protein 2 n=1 Tax=Girardinichthys multiradiatus TaxID=208333 RepID=UPI001FAD790C|nr:zinc finger HIT domain-containing protein 2 [Girardinichthys multiradiatus]XP_047207797.1 zinc finger HIT domain-containing protein 2 [Girardinichthys multiradiatus]